MSETETRLRANDDYPLLALTGVHPVRNPVVANVAGIAALLAVSAVVAYPVGLASAGVWWLFEHGWSVIG